MASFSEPEPEAWVAIPSESDLRPHLPEQIPYDFGFVARIGRLVAAHDGIGPILGQLVGVAMVGPGELELQEREMVAAVAAASQGCSYLASTNAEVMRSEGGEPGLVEAIKSGAWRSASDLSGRARALCTVAEKLGRDPADMRERDWDDLRSEGLGDRGCLEVAHIVGAFSYLSRLALGFGLELEPQFEPDAVKREPIRRVGRPMPPQRESGSTSVQGSASE